MARIATCHAYLFVRCLCLLWFGMTFNAFRQFWTCHLLILRTTATIELSRMVSIVIALDWKESTHSVHLYCFCCYWFARNRAINRAVATVLLEAQTAIAISPKHTDTEREPEIRSKSIEQQITTLSPFTRARARTDNPQHTIKTAAH